MPKLRNLVQAAALSSALASSLAGCVATGRPQDLTQGLYEAWHDPFGLRTKVERTEIQMVGGQLTTFEYMSDGTVKRRRVPDLIDQHGNQIYVERDLNGEVLYNEDGSVKTETMYRLKPIKK